MLAVIWFLYPLTGSGSDLGDYVFWHPLVKTGMSFLQLYVIIFIFQLLKQEDPVPRFFSWVGRNTLTIMLSHMLISSLAALALGLYSSSVWGYITSPAEMFDVPENVLFQSVCLWIVTEILSLLLCFAIDCIKNIRTHRKPAV